MFKYIFFSFFIFQLKFSVFYNFFAQFSFNYFRIFFSVLIEYWLKIAFHLKNFSRSPIAFKNPIFSCSNATVKNTLKLQYKFFHQFAVHITITKHNWILIERHCINRFSRTMMGVWGRKWGKYWKINFFWREERDAE